MDLKTLTRLTLAALLAVAGCKDDTESVSQVTKFRVLAVQADPPEVQPGEGAVFRVLFADPEGAGRQIEVLWFGCIGLFEPDQKLTKECRLLSAPQISKIGQGGDTYQIPPLPSDVLGSDETTTQATAFVIGCAGGTIAVPDDLFDSEAVPSLGKLCRGGDTLVVTKTLTISKSESPNTNPQISAVTMGGGLELTEVSSDAPRDEAERFSCTKGDGCRDQVALEAFLTKESFEQFTEERFGEKQTRDERVYISWFITGGSFDRNRSGIADPPGSEAPSWGPFECTWFPPRQGGVFDLWVVAHDLRGGVSWKHYLVEAVPAR